MNWDVMDVGSQGPHVGALQWYLGHNRYGWNFQPGEVDQAFGERTRDAVKRAKWRLGYANVTGTAGYALFSYLVPRAHGDYQPRPLAMQARSIARRGKRNPYATNVPAYPSPPWPFASRNTGTLNGLPGQGTHSFTTPPNNWESDNAVDLNVPTGTPVLAVADGVIGSQWGPLDSTDTHMLGLRLHLVTENDEWYYAHLSRLDVRPGVRVRRGARLGLSGSAAGVEHLHIAQRDARPDVTLDVYHR